MRMVLLSALLAAGLGAAASAPTSAAPLAGLGGAPDSLSLVQDAQVVIVEPRRPRCRTVRVCRRNAYGVVRCHYDRVCRR